MSSMMQAKVKKGTPDKKRKLSLLSFFGELKEELKKVSWTTKEELIFCTKVVVVATFCFGIGIYGVDLAVKGALELIKKTALFIIG